MMYKVGDVIQGTITGIKPYGAFVRIDEFTSGLIHISEISDFYISDVNRFFNKGEKIVVKVIDIDDKGQLRLSLKAIQTNRKYAVPTRRDISSINRLGFSSLENVLGKWIEETLNKEEYQ